MTRSELCKDFHDEADVAARLVPVVLGSDILGYSCVRLFHEAYGLHSIVIGTAEVKAVSTSRFAEVRVLPGAADEEVLIPYLEKLGRQFAAEGKVGMLVGSGDWYARAFSQNKKRLEKWFVVPYIDFDLLDSITQKETFYKMCEELGIAYPKTMLLDCADPNETLDAHALTYPLIAKPSNSARYHYAKFPDKRKVYEIYTPEELETVFRHLQGSSYDRSLIVQEFVPGDDDAMHSITIYADENSEPAITCSGRVVLQDHSPTGIGNPVCILSDEGALAEPVRQAAKFLKHVGYHGWANFDVKYDERDGSYKFFEVNTRLGRNSFYVYLAGVNFIQTMVDDTVLGRSIDHRAASKPFLYTCVPQYVVKRTVEDEALKKRIAQMYRDGSAQFPLFYKPDSLMQKFWAAVTYYHQISKFSKYVWKTHGRQVAAE